VIYDFQYLPFSLGDILTWTVHLAVQAQEAKWEPREIRYRHQLRYTHPMQPFIHAGEGKKYLGELPEAFLFNPLGLKTVEEKEAHPTRECVLTEYGRDLKNIREESREGIDIRKQTRFFIRHVASHANLNQYYQQGGKIPLLNAPVAIAKQTAKLIRQATGKNKWICLHIRFRGYDQRWDLSDASRNADPVAWFQLLEAISASYHRTHAILLMGEIANYPPSFQEIPGIVSLRAKGGTLQNDLAAVLGAEAFLGSSSGFATAANFSSTPYVIFNVTPSGFQNYAISQNAGKLPFAHSRQFLDGSGQDPAAMVKMAARILPKIKVRARPRRPRRSDTRQHAGLGLAAFSATLLARIDRHDVHQSADSLEEYFQAFEAVIPEAKNSFEVHLARKLADKAGTIQDEFVWRAFRKLTEIRAEAARKKVEVILQDKKIFITTALPLAVRARELAPYDIRVRSFWNLLRRAQKLRCKRVDRTVLRLCAFFWAAFYRLFYGFGTPYRSKNLNP
jgi:hypothetical protein